MTFDAVCVTFIDYTEYIHREGRGGILFTLSHTDTPRSTDDRVACATVWTQASTTPIHKQDQELLFPSSRRRTEGTPSPSV